MLLVLEEDEFPTKDARISSSIRKTHIKLLSKNPSPEIKRRGVKTARSSSSIDFKMCLAKFSVT